MSSKTYWRDRELEWKKKRLKDEKQYADEIQEIYANMMDSVEKEIESFFSRYANKENITMAEAKKKVSNIDIKAYQRKAKKYVKEKNFSDEANEQMRLYNLAMKVNRLELLKANIGLELVAGHDELKSYTGDKLEGAYLEEIKRNASILGDTVIDNAKMAKTVADSSFKNATFSERIWVNQDQLKNNLSSVLSNALIQGKNPREFIPQIRKKFDVSRCNAERLLRTEIARVQTQAQVESYEANGIDEFEYVACGLKDVCPLCKEMDGKVFKLKDMEIGENAPPLHPNCHCSTAPYSYRKVYEQWLDGLANGEHSLRFDEWKEQNGSLQAYRSLEKGDKETFVINRVKVGLKNVSASKLNSYSHPVYLSDKANITRRGVHIIHKNTQEAYKKYKFNSLEFPKIVIVDQEELPGAFGLYDCVTNTVYYSSDITSREGMKQHGGIGITEFHEMWHAKQADIFKSKGWDFTKKNRNEYIQALRKDCKHRIDKLSITSDNVSEISVYAESMYDDESWDEVEADYYAIHRKGL